MKKVLLFLVITSFYTAQSTDEDGTGSDGSRKKRREDKPLEIQHNSQDYTSAAAAILLNMNPTENDTSAVAAILLNMNSTENDTSAGKYPLWTKDPKGRLLVPNPDPRKTTPIRIDKLHERLKKPQYRLEYYNKYSSEFESLGYMICKKCNHIYSANTSPFRNGHCKRRFKFKVRK